MVQAAKTKTQPPKTPEKTKSFARGIFAACVGLLLAGLGVFMALSFVTGDAGIDPGEAARTCWTGLLGAWMAYGGLFTLGRAPALLLSVLIFLWGVHVARTMRIAATWPQVIGGVLVVTATALGVCAFDNTYDMNTGGLLAVYASPPAILYFGRWGLIVAALGVMVLGMLLAFGEAAVNTVHRGLLVLRDIAVGLLGTGGRALDLLRLLARPRLAVATAGVAGASVSSAASAAPAPAVAAPAQRAAQAPAKEWKPRETFKSRFLNVDLRNAVPADPVEPRDETIGSPLASSSESSGVIVDVDAMMEESDMLIDSAIEKVLQPEFPFPKIAARKPVEQKPEPKAEAEIETPKTEMPKAEPKLESKAAAEADDLPSLAEVAAAAAAAASRAAEQLKITPQSQPQPREAQSALPRSSAPATSAISATPTAPVPPAAATKAVDPAKAAAEAELAAYVLPPLEILDPPEPPVMEDAGLIEAKAKILEQTLAEFKIEGRVVHIERGPRVTMYELSLAPGIRLNKVTSLADNIAMQLQAESVRIIAPIPGKNTIGIEIPNTCKDLVSLREIVGAVNREKRRQALPVCLGKDVSGQALVADLARMPHLLIAGATGSGKSVCINSIIMSVMMCCKPDETQLIMVDPKVVELSRFKDIPHLMSPVITDMKRAVSVLDWICQKMDERYEQMSLVSVNNIAKFNALGDAGIREKLDEFASLEDIEAFPKKMPYMVVIIDELADLMMVAGKEVEQHITRLAAKSRAVGIHLILATQRPSVDVITGLIKANMPCRIAFQVASRVDSRTILDGNGAETLLGQGDMLYLPPGVGKLTRAQGVFVSDEELFRVVDFVKAEAAPQYHEDLLGPVIGGNSGTVDVSKFDDLFLESGEAIIENQRGSVSLLQRKFGIGYGRASRIIDQLASVGLLGPFRDGKAREILLTLEEFRAKFGGDSSRSGGSGGGAPWEDDDDGEYGMAGLRDDERERPQADWDDENEE